MLRQKAEDLYKKDYNFYKIWMVQRHSLDVSGFEYVEYYQVVRDPIEEYRLLFIDCVAGFDKWDYIIDRFIFILK